MKKEIVTMLLAAALMTSSLTACATAAADGKNIDTTTAESPFDQNTEMQTSTKDPHAKIIDYLCSMVEFAESKKLSTFEDLEEWDEQFCLSDSEEDRSVSHKLHFTIGYAYEPCSFSYAISDLNADGIDELLLMNLNDYEIRAIFSIVDGKLTLLKENGVGLDGAKFCSVDENGFIYSYYYTKGENWAYRVHRIGPDGALTLFEHFGCSDPNIDGNYNPDDLRFYRYINGEYVDTTKEDIDNLLQIYDPIIGQWGKLTQNSGLSIVPLLPTCPNHGNNKLVDLNGK